MLKNKQKYLKLGKSLETMEQIQFQCNAISINNKEKEV